MPQKEVPTPLVEIDEPIPQTEPCCKKVCNDLNEEIDARKELIGAIRTRFFKFGHGEADEEGKPLPSLRTVEQPYPSTEHDFNALEDLRNRLAEEGICKCAIKKKVPETEVPKKEIKRKIYPTTLSPGSTRHTKVGTPILPSPVANGCCIDVCRTLNGQIKSRDDILDASVVGLASRELVAEEESIRTRLSKLGLPAEEIEEEMTKKRESLEKSTMTRAEYLITKSEKGAPLTYQSYMLKQYREYMKKNNICRCEL